MKIFIKKHWLIAIAIMISLSFAIIFLSTHKEVAEAENYAVFTAVFAVQDIQWHLWHDGQRINADKAIELGFNQDELGRFIICSSTMPISSRDESWILVQILR